MTQPFSEGVQAAGRFPSPAPLFPGCPGLFVQTRASEKALHAAAPLVREEGMGVVFTVSSTTKHRHEKLKRLTNLHRGVAGPVDHVFFDANRYSGEGRSVGRIKLDRDWITAQHDLGARVALTDSPYIGERDTDALHSTLDQAARFGAWVVAVLPLHLHWLTKNTTALVEAINAAGVPVALVLEHKADPLGVQAAVAGLTKVLRAALVPVGLLRSDLSVIGAVAFGGAFGAIGTSTDLRHIYPQPEPGTNKSEFGRSPEVGVFVPWSMGYRTIKKIGRIVSADYEHLERYRCLCRFCNNHTLDWIKSEADAYQHSLAAVAVLGEEVLGSPTMLGRQHTWVSACTRAQRMNQEIAADSGMSWESPNYLAGWHKLHPTLPPRPVVTTQA